MSISLLKRLSLRASLILVMASAVAAMPCSAQSEPTVQSPNVVMTDPIFGLEYDPSKVHFEQLDTSVLVPSCNRFLSSFNPLPRKLDIYAQYKGGRTSIYVADAAPEHDSDIFVFRNGICDSGSASLSMRQIHANPPDPSDGPVLSDAEVAALFKDALIRYQKAFGGKASFLAWLEDSLEWKAGGCKSPPAAWCPNRYDNPIQPFVLEILNNYRKSQSK